MRLSAKALAFATAIIWAGGILCVGLINLAAPSYGASFLQGVSSIYPGYHNTRHFLDVLVGTGYGLVDGGIGGWIFAWIYNCFAGQPKQAS
jgi:hypothetical protein